MKLKKVIRIWNTNQSYSQNKNKSEDAAVKELFAPGPVKEFDDFDYKYERPPKKSGKSSSGRFRVIQSVCSSQDNSCLQK